MQTLNLSVPRENINEIASMVESRLFMRLEKFISDNKPNQYLSAEKICERLDITKPSLHEWRRKGIIQSYKIGGRVYYRWDEVEAAMIVND